DSPAQSAQSRYYVVTRSSGFIPVIGKILAIWRPGGMIVGARMISHAQLCSGLDEFHEDVCLRSLATQGMHCKRVTVRVNESDFRPVGRKSRHRLNSRHASETGKGECSRHSTTPRMGWSPKGNRPG